MTASHFHLSDTLLQRPTNSTLLVSIVWIINHVYAGYTNSLTFSLWSRTAADDSLQIELLSEILTSIRETELTYVIENSEDVQCGEDNSVGDECLLREDVMLLVDSFESFMLFKTQLVKRNFHIGGFYTIIYTARGQRYYDDITRILKELFNIYIINVNLFVELPHETLVYSYYPFTQYHCHSATPVVHNRYTMEDGFAYPKPFFPRKTDNFYGCVIKVATWSAPPFVYFRKEPSGNWKILGIEGSLIRTLAAKMNFTIKIEDAKLRGWIYSNLTAAAGAVKMIVDGKANVTINSFVYSNLSLKTMLASYTYATYPMIVAIPRGQQMSSLQRLTRPFKYIIWSCLSSSVLAGITIIFVIKCLQKKTVSDFVFGHFNQMPFTNLINIFLGGQVTVLPRRNFARYILFVWLWFTMVMRNAYTGELFIMLQDSSARTSLKSIEELIDRNFTLMCTDNTLNVIRSTAARHIKIIKGQPSQYLSQLHNSAANAAVVILRPFLRLYNQMLQGRPHIQTLPKALVTVPLTMYFRKDSYLLEVVNEHLVDFMSAGLMKIWNQFYLPREDVMQDEVGGAPTVLSVQLLTGLFSVYLLCLGFCILVFGLEMWSRYSPICRNVMNFLNC